MTRGAVFLLASIPALVCSAPAAAADKAVINLPDARLATIVPLLSRQAGLSISVADERLWNMQITGVRGRMSIERLMKRLLEGTGARAVKITATSWRIERQPPPARQARRTRAMPQPDRFAGTDDLIAAPHDEIIVTASKTDLPFDRFAGVVTRIDGGDLALAGERGTESILSRVATVSSTHLGSGRNKLFIRGIADSSFTGPTQATVGQYLGDIRLSYNAPDPDLRLYDVEDVEILEGPQGTLYGAGSLGGIIRMVPRAPDARASQLQLVAGTSLTQHGEPGGDIGLVANLPLASSGHAARLVGYMVSDGGYIDNPLLGQNDVNRVDIHGGRGTFRFDAGDQWTIDLGGVYQSIRSNDAQYADKNAPPLERNSLVDQFARSRYAMGTVIIAKDWGALYFQSSNAYIRHRLFERFDAGRTGEPTRILDQANSTHLFTSETRLSRPFDDGLGWVVGVSLIDNQTLQRRKFDTEMMRTAQTGVTNRISEFTAFAEANIEILPQLIGSAGLRLAHARLGGRGEDMAQLVLLAGEEMTASRNETDALPSFSLLASPLENVTLYARYQEGFRPGGLALDSNFVRRFRNDLVRTFEAGLRFGDKGRTPLDAYLAASYSKWHDIQADFIDSNGFPSTANIGNGRITSVSAALAIRPLPRLSIDLAGVYNHSRVDELFAGELRAIASQPGTEAGPQTLPLILARLGQIPNVARYSLRGAFDFAAPLRREELRLSGWANYVGPSRVGIGPILGESQGKYLDTGLAARIGTARRGFTLTLTNLLDTRGNRFALGTPFVEGSPGYLTPLRPRTLRIAVDLSY